MARTYSWVNLYLKGLHLTIDMWRPARDTESGWPICYLDKSRDRDWVEVSDSVKAPETVEPRAELRAWLSRDVRCLLELFSGERPAEQICRAIRCILATFLMGKASGDGFGSTIIEGGRVEYQAAGWNARSKSESSNWQEAHNLTTQAEQKGAEGCLEGKELFLITNNKVFEATYYKGHSRSPKLNEIVFRLHQLERNTGAVFHVIHVVGTRMMESGVDGLSRRNFMMGIMLASKDPLSFLPFYLGANERTSGRVQKCVQSWWSMGGKRRNWFSGKPPKLLAPKDWFTLYENNRPRLWCPLPGAMTTVVELFNEDRLVHPKIPHVFCVPCLMTHLWREALMKNADLEF